MNQASGAYRMQVTALLGGIALVLVGSLNLDAVRISNYILDRGSVKAPAEKAAARGTPTSGVLPPSVVRPQPAPLPIGWPRAEIADLRSGPSACLLKFVGLLVSIISIIAGAPFLFDVLNRFMVVRSTVKPIDYYDRPAPAAQGRASERVEPSAR